MSREKYDVEVFHKGVGDYKEKLESMLIVEPGSTVTHRILMPDLYFPHRGGCCTIGKEGRYILRDGEALELKAEARIVIKRRKEEVVKSKVETRLPWYRRLWYWFGQW